MAFGFGERQPPHGRPSCAGPRTPGSWSRRPGRECRAAAPQFAEFGPGASCAGIDYPRLIDGELDFVLFWRTLPWDHAAGTLLVTEAGGTARRLNGTEYCPADVGPGLLNAAGDVRWHAVRPLLLADPRPGSRTTSFLA